MCTKVVSIDIADIDIGDNIGALPQESQAEANKKIAQAQTEIRRAAVLKQEQETKAIAAAFLSGNMGVMDY